MDGDEKKNKGPQNYKCKYEEAVGAYKKIMRQSVLIKTKMIRASKIAVISAMSLYAWEQLTLQQKRYLIAHKMMKQMNKMKIGSNDDENYKMALEILRTISIPESMSILKDDQKLKTYITKMSCN